MMITVMDVKGFRLIGIILAIFLAIPLIISCSLATPKIFYTPSGKIEMDFPRQLTLVDEHSENFYLRSFCEEDFCKYGFTYDPQPLDLPYLFLTVTVWNINSSSFKDLTFEQYVKEAAIVSMPSETSIKVLESNFTIPFTPPGEWTITDEGRQMYFDESPPNGAPYALIDFADQGSYVDIYGNIHIDRTTLLTLGKSFKLNSSVTSEPESQIGFEFFLAIICLILTGYLRRNI
jgi:hypothetical protein